MTELLDLIFDASSGAILKNAFLAIVLSSITFGVIGTIVVTKRITFMAGSISHSVLGGIGIGIFLEYHLQLPSITPMIGAIIFAILMAIFIGFSNIYFKDRPDSIIGAVWPLGMAIGLIFIHKTPGLHDPMDYLFGNVLLISSYDLIALVILNVISITFISVIYQKFIGICFNEEFMRLRGINTNLYNMLILIIVSLAIVLLVNIVGVVMVVALLTIPATIANHYSNRINIIMLIASLISLLFNFAGLTISYHYDLPTGPTIIIVATCGYVLSGLMTNINFTKQS